MKLKILLISMFVPTLLFCQQTPFDTPMEMPKSYIEDFNPTPQTQVTPTQAPQQSPLKIHIERVKKPEKISIQKSHEPETLKIAIIIPSKIIGRYATSTTNAVFAYMLTKNSAFEIKTFDIQTQDKDNLAKTLRNIENQGFHYAIAVLTKDGADKIISLNPQINIFIPTINKSEVSSSSSHLYFGGIDYKAQTDKLLKEAHTPLLIFKDASPISEKISDYAQSKYHNKSYTFSMDKSTNLKKQFKNSRFKNASFLTNTPIVKTGMILSQITLYKVNQANILSTQINYDPLILTMTQYDDRKDMIIANSILKDNTAITDANLMLSNDITYDWINYATTVGVDYFYNRITNEAREYPLAMSNNQIIYPINLVQPSYSSFVNYKSNEK
jgi:SRSO17 transposase